MLNVIRADSEKVPALDRGLAYGDGLFETIRMQGARAVLRSFHLDRMVADAGRLGIPLSRAELDAQLTRSGQDHGSYYAGDDWVLKVVLTRGSGGRGYRLPEHCEPSLIVSASAMPPLPDPAGVIAASSGIPLTVNPCLAGMKSLNRLEQVMASRELTGEEYERIMSDSEGHLVEGTRTNLFVRLGDEWFTPPVRSLAVAGVMRRYVLGRLQATGFSVSESPIRPSMLASSDFRGLYLVNSVMGLARVRKMDGRDLPLDDELETICAPLNTLE